MKVNILKRITYGTISGGVVGFGMYYPQINRHHVYAETKNVVNPSIFENLWTKGTDTLPEFSKLIGEMIGTKDKPKKNQLITQAEKLKEPYEIKKDVYPEHVYKFWDDQNYNYVIIGASGTGKSSFANALLEKPYLFETGIKETTHSDTIGCHVYNQSNNEDARQIVFWDIPGFGTTKYEPEPYIKRFGLPKFDGIILMTSSRFTDRDLKFFKALREKEIELWQAIPDRPAEHVPVYVVRTKFDVDLDSKLKQFVYCRKYNYWQWILSFFYSKKIKHNEFMDIWDQSLTELQDQAKKQFSKTFSQNDDENDKKLMEYFFIVSSDWMNRMLTTYKNYGNDKLTQYNGHGGEFFGWYAIWRRLLHDALYFNGEGIANTKSYDDINKYIEERFKNNKEPSIKDSNLYKQYVTGFGPKINTLITWISIGTLSYHTGVYMNKTAPVGAPPPPVDWYKLAFLGIGSLLTVGVSSYGVYHFQSEKEETQRMLEEEQKEQT